MNYPTVFTIDRHMHFAPSSTAISHLLLPSTFFSASRPWLFWKEGKERKGGKGYLSKGGSGSGRLREREGGRD